MKKILRIEKGVKVRRARVNHICELPLETMDVDVKAELIQMLILIGLLHVKKLLEEEVGQLAGERYKRSGLPGYEQMGKGVRFLNRDLVRHKILFSDPQI
jgi:hypothetical protein